VFVRLRRRWRALHAPQHLTPAAGARLGTPHAARLALVAHTRRSGAAPRRPEATCEGHRKPERGSPDAAREVRRRALSASAPRRHSPPPLLLPVSPLAPTMARTKQTARCAPRAACTRVGAAAGSRALFC
jgi:hypothetical protein